MQADLSVHPLCAPARGNAATYVWQRDSAWNSIKKQSKQLGLHHRNVYAQCTHAWSRPTAATVNHRQTYEKWDCDLISLGAVHACVGPVDSGTGPTPRSQANGNYCRCNLMEHFMFSTCARGAGQFRHRPLRRHRPVQRPVLRRLRQVNYLSLRASTASLGPAFRFKSATDRLLALAESDVASCCDEAGGLQLKAAQPSVPAAPQDGGGRRRH